jgi:sporulation protein YlmC with PRC-barrel domain
MAPDDDNPAIEGSESADDERTSVLPEVADQGKPVVDARGTEVGMVSDVEGRKLYVAPDPTPTEAVLSKLHWRNEDRDDLEVPAERIERIDDEVVLDEDPRDPSDPGSRA